MFQTLTSTHGMPTSLCQLAGSLILGFFSRKILYLNEEVSELGAGNNRSVREEGEEADQPDIGNN